MPEQQRRGCSPHPSFPCSPAQTRFQVPSALESTLQAIQDPSTCYSSCAILLPCSSTLVSLQPSAANTVSLSSAPLLRRNPTITLPTDAAVGLLADKLLIRVCAAESVRAQSMAAKRQHDSALPPRTASH